MQLCDFTHDTLQNTFTNTEDSAVHKAGSSAFIEFILQINRIISDIGGYHEKASGRVNDAGGRGGW